MRSRVVVPQFTDAKTEDRELNNLSMFLKPINIKLVLKATGIFLSYQFAKDITGLYPRNINSISNKITLFYG